MENNYISFFFNAICGLLGYCLARHAILRTNNGTKRTSAWRRETKRKKKDDLFLDDENKISLLDLPDLTLDCILEKLSASELCLMTCVCSELREKCVSDHLWEKHMEKKWGRLMGAAATLEWKSHVAAMSTERPSCGSKRRRSSSFPVAIDSVMYCMCLLDSGGLFTMLKSDTIPRLIHFKQDFALRLQRSLGTTNEEGHHIVSPFFEFNVY